MNPIWELLAYAAMLWLVSYELRQWVSMLK